MKIFHAFCLALLHAALMHGQGTFTPKIVNPQVQLDGHKIILTYYLNHPVDGASTVILRAGPKGAKQLDYDTSNATGDIGPGISPWGGQHTIEWDFSAYGEQDFRLQLIAIDSTEVNVQSVVDEVAESWLLTYLSNIVGVRHRETNPAHLEAVKEYIRGKFEEAELETTLHTFDYNGYQAANIIGRKMGLAQETEVLIIDGHFDTVADSPGADDNGSAIAGMLEALRVLENYEFDKTIKFIGFDLEEAGSGLVGSKRYVDEELLPPEEVKGVINLEMIGYYSDEPNTQNVPPGFEFLFPQATAQLEADSFRGNFITNVSYKNSLPLSNAFSAAAAAYVPELKVIQLHAETLVPDLLRSDHAWFWFKGIPALMITDGAEFRNPHYHSPEDKMQYLDFTFMRRVVQAVVATVAEVGGIRAADQVIIDTDFFPSATGEAASCELSLHPNPTAGPVVVEAMGCSDGTAYNWALYSVTGQRVSHGSAVAPFHLNLSDLPAGLYFLRLRNAGQSAVLKVVKR